ncbi:MAG: HU family DNA-binding protein [Bacteroides sp.]|nr:HU family DNA-binding protein [Bacteroides sp.]
MAQILLKTNYRKLGILDEKKYLTTALRYSTISVDDLIKYAAENSGLSKANVAAVFYALAQQIEQFACNGHSIQLGKLGTLYLTANTKAADTEKEAGANAVESLCIRFRQSKYLRDMVNSNVSLSTINLQDFASDEEPEDDDEDGGNDSGNTDGGGDDELDPLG